MKKLSIFLVAVLLIASLFVSCDNTTKAITDEHVKVTFSVDSGSRGLGYTIEPIPDTDLQWYYTAVKSDPNDPFKFGEVPEDNPVEVTLGNEITFSQGLWDFTLFARRKDVESQPIVYSGASSDVLITRAENPVPIIVHVSPSTAGVNGTLTLNNVSINTYAGEGHVSSSVMANRAVIKNSEGTEIDTLNLSNGSYTGYVLPAGDYSVVVKYYNTNGNVENASEEIFITVWSGRTTTIRGNVDEITGTGTLNKYITEDTVNSTITSSSDSAEFVAKVAPVNSENSADGTTTVSFAANSLVQSATETDVSLKVSVKDIETAGNTFTVVGNNQSAVAGISLSLTVDGENKTGSFGDAVISTYIVKGLTSVNVKYNGTEYTNEPGVIEVINSTQTPEDNTKYYESDTGKLVFSTNHFSEYYVVSNPVVAINETTNTAYETLAEAISNATSNDTILILKNISNINSSIDISKSLTIDGNNKKLSYEQKPTVAKSKIVNIKADNICVELKNLTIGDEDTISARGINISGSNNTIIIDSCKVLAKDYSLFIAGKKDEDTIIEKLNITINNSSFDGWGTIYNKASEVNLNANNTLFNSANYNSTGGSSNSFSNIIVAEYYDNDGDGLLLSEKNNFTFTGCTFTAEKIYPNSNVSQAVCDVRSPNFNRVNFNNCNFTKLSSPEYLMLAIDTVFESDLDTRNLMLGKSHIYIDGVEVSEDNSILNSYIDWYYEEGVEDGITALCNNEYIINPIPYLDGEIISSSENTCTVKMDQFPTKQYVFTSEERDNGTWELTCQVQKVVTSFIELKNTLLEAENGDTIALAEDIQLTEQLNISKNVTLNLGTYKITGKEGDAAIMLTGGANVTVNATTGGVIGTGSNGDCFKMPDNNVSTAELTINGGTYSSGSGYFVNINADTFTPDTRRDKLTINGETYSGARIINANPANTEIVMNGGSLTGTGTGISFGTNSTNSTFTMTGGSIKYENGSVITGQAQGNEFNISGTANVTGKLSLSNCEMNITGGIVNITGSPTDNRALRISTGSTLNISGDAKVKGDPLFNMNGGTVNITGGSFSGKIVNGLNYGNSYLQSVEDLLTDTDYQLSGPDSDGWYKVNKIN